MKDSFFIVHSDMLNNLEVRSLIVHDQGTNGKWILRATKLNKIYYVIHEFT